MIVRKPLGRLAIVGCLLLGVACGDSALPERRRVVLIEARGASWQGLLEQVDSGRLPPEGPLARLVRDGVAAPLQPIAAAETFPAMATFESGAEPGSHGIVANRYRRLEDATGSASIAYLHARPAVETLWEAAARQGRSVVRIGTLLPRGSRDDTGGVRSLPQPEALDRPAVYELESPSPRPQDGSSVLPLLVSSNGPGDAGGAIEVIVGEGDAGRVALWPSVRDDDGDGLFDTLLLDDDRDPGNGTVVAWREGWAEVPLQAGPPAVGLWAYLLELDADTPRARLYIRAPHRNRGSPESFVAGVEGSLSFPPGSPGYGLMASGQLPPEVIVDEVEREVRYVLDTTLRALEEDPAPGLLIVDDPVFDRLGHPFWLVDPRQPRPPGSAEPLAGWHALAASAYRRLDEHLAELESRLPADTVLVVASSYAFAAVHTRIGLPALLSSLGVEHGQEAGLQAVAGTVTANLYLDEHLPSPTARTSELAAALEGARDPRTSERIFDLVLTRDRLGEVGLDHPHAGDVWARTRPGYTLAGGPGSPLLGQPRFPGEHGFSPDDVRSQGLLLLRLPGSPSRRIKSVRAVDVAVTVAALLGIEPPQGSEGIDALATP